MKKLIILSIAMVCLAIACIKQPENEPKHEPIRSDAKGDSTSANRYRSDEVIVVFKRAPTSAEVNTIMTSLAETGIDTASLTRRKCGSCENSYVELWQADSIHTMIRATALGGGTVSDRGETVGEDELAHYSLNFFNSIPMDSSLKPDTIIFNGKVTRFSGAGKDTIMVAVLDTGLDTTWGVSSSLQWKNADEKSNGKDDDRNCYVDDILGWNFIGNNSDVTDDNMSLHGTLVTHFIINEFARSPKNFVQIMSLKTHDENGGGDLFYSICAIHYAMNNGANIINASWGFYYYQDTPHPYLDLLITKTLRERGILFVTAAGNTDEEADRLAKKAYFEEYEMEFPDDMLRNLEYHNFYPACLSRKGKNVITVTTTDGKLVSSTQNYSEKYVDIGVMGEGNEADVMKFKTPFAEPNALVGGSSFATAIACGKFGAYIPKSKYERRLDKDAVFDRLRGITPDGRPRLITREPAMEKELIREGAMTYPK